jgi:Zn-dependent peptidase ImmA (M78 family)/DNA-binding XRE family transcriptional regulator
MPNSITSTPVESFNRSVLEWARKQAAYESEEIDKLLNVEVGTVRGWEKGFSNPNIETLRNLSYLYDIPFAYFFLEILPDEPQLRDYRGVPKEKRRDLSRYTRLSLREFRRLSRLASTLQDITGISTVLKVGAAHSQEDPEQVAEREFARIGIRYDDRQAWASKEEAYRVWREKIESLGIFVFSLPMLSSECRGASIVTARTCAILVNQSDAPAGRSFTLFHEYYHLILHTSRELMICDLYPGNSESFANRFSTSFLVPEKEFIEILETKNLAQYQQWWTDTELSDLADIFYVSRDVIAIRLENLRFAPEGFYRHKREHWDQLFHERGGFGRGGKSKKTYAQDKLGSNFYNLTLNAVRANMLNPVEAALYVGQVRPGRRPWTIKASDVESWIK